MEEYFVVLLIAVQREITIAGIVVGAKSPGKYGYLCVIVAVMIIPVGGVRPHALAGGLIGLGAVFMLTASRFEDWRALTFLGLALIIPSVVWLVADQWFRRPRGVVWWLLIAASVALGVWGITLIPAT